MYSMIPYEFDYWIGLNDLVSPGTWVWQYSFQPLEYTSWGSGQPRTDAPYHCAFLVRKHPKPHNLTN